MKIPLLLSGLQLLALAATAQVYAAPGMPVQLGSRQPLTLAKAPKPVSPIPRFWHNPDLVARQKGAAYLITTIQRHAKLPKAAMVAGVEGKIFARAILTAEGLLTDIKVVGRSSSLNSASAEAVGALDAETIRVMQLLRFAPASSAPDSITIPLGYLMQ